MWVGVGKQPIEPQLLMGRGSKTRPLELLVILLSHFFWKRFDMKGAHIFILPAVSLLDLPQRRHPSDWGTGLRHNDRRRRMAYWSKASLCNLNCCCTLVLSINGLPSWFKVPCFVSMKFARQLSLNSEKVIFRAIVSCPVFIIAPQHLYSERRTTFSGGGESITKMNNTVTGVPSRLFVRLRKY